MIKIKNQVKQALKDGIAKWHGNESWKDFQKEIKGDDCVTYGNFDVDLDTFADAFKNPKDGEQFFIRKKEIIIIPTNTFGSGCDFDIAATCGLNHIKDILGASGIIEVKIYELADNEEPGYAFVFDEEEDCTLYQFSPKE